MKSALKIIQHGTDSLRELITLYLSTILIGAVLFSVIEHVGLWDSIYWAFITGLSIGYGDFSPHTFAGKVLTIVLANCILLFIIPIFIGRALQKVLPDRNEFTHEEQEEIKRILRKLDKKK